MAAIARILDANANRAREALRVLEDAARFALDDQVLSGELKTLRHELRAALDGLHPSGGWLEANRNTPGDVGTAISTPAEMNRASLLDVVIAAGKRLTESLRVIEEMSKTINGEVAACIEQLRYRAYDIEARVQARFATQRAQQWRLCVLLTSSICKRPWQDVLCGAIEGGADCVQVREPKINGGELAAVVRQTIDIARPRGVCVIVNDRVDVALATGADGVHLGQSDISVRDARRIAGRSLIIGASTHDLDEAQAAVESGADYCGVGAMFATMIKPDRKPSGPAFLAAFVERFPNIPHLAIGGITPANVDRLVQSGARGVAVSSAICAADDPSAAARAIVQRIAGE